MFDINSSNILISLNIKLINLIINNKKANINIMYDKNLDKKVFLWMHSRKLLNQYFFLNDDFIKLKSNLQILKGVFSLFYIYIFQKYILINFYASLPKENSFKNFTTKIYSLIFFSLLKKHFRNSIFVIGDIDYPIYQALLLSSSYYRDIDLWVIFQGTGSIEKKINIKYPNNVKKVFFPFSSDSYYENKLLKKASNLNQIEFINIDTSLNIILSNNNNNLVIFQGYNKKRKLYPFYIFEIVRSILEISLIKEINYFDSVSLYLHPRIKFLIFLNLFIFKSNVKLKIYDNKIKNFYKYVISYSPTINSSFNLKLKHSKNVLMELGTNFNKKDIKNKIRILLKENKN